MRYRLATYRECRAHREWNTTCPACGRRGKFVPYIDTHTMRPVDDHRCGSCNRKSNCGYHLPPRQMPRTEDSVSHRSHKSHRSCIAESTQLSAMPSACSHPARTLGEAADCPSVHGGTSEAEEVANEVRSRNTTRSACNPNAQREQETHCEKMRRACKQSQPWGSLLVTWLHTRFPREAVAAAIKRYRVGGTPDGATLWWQIDSQGRVRTGKAMHYHPLTGHRVKEETRLNAPVNWAHRMRLYGEPTELVVPQCLFGEHLLNENRTPLRPSLNLVESEKTALILSILKPGTVWLATGGKQNLKESMLAPLIGLDVALYPDADALHQWYARAVEMNHRLGTRLHIPTWYYNLMDHDEARREGWDLADVILSSEVKDIEG